MAMKYNHEDAHEGQPVFCQLYEKPFTNHTRGGKSIENLLSLSTANVK